MKRFFRFYMIFKESVSSLDFYRTLNHQPVNVCVSYLVFILTLCALFLAVNVLIHFMPYLKLLQSTSAKDLGRLLPPAITLTLRHGELTVNQDKAVFLVLERLKNVPGIKRAFPRLKYLAVIDPQGTPQDVTRLQTPLLITKNTLIIPAARFLPLTIPLKLLPDMVIDQPVFENTLAKIKPWLWLAVLLILPSMMVLMGGIGLVYGLLSLGLTLLTTLLVRLLGIYLPFRHNFLINFYLGISLLFFTLIASLFGSPLIILPLFGVVWLLVNLIIQLTLETVP